MDEQLYPKFDDDKHVLNYMMDKIKLLNKDYTHYRKIKAKWSVANTMLRACGI